MFCTLNALYSRLLILKTRTAAVYLFLYLEASVVDLVLMIGIEPVDPSGMITLPLSLLEELVACPRGELGRL